MITTDSETTTRFPWPPSSGESALTSFFETWKQSTFSPTEFFRDFPAGGLGSALLYYLIVGVIASAFDAIWGMLAGLAQSSIVAALGGQMDAAEALFGIWSPIIGFFFSPFFLVLQLFFLAVVFHVTLIIVGGANRDFKTTARVLCFAYSPRLFAILPFLGGLIGGIWIMVTTIIGLKEAHRTDTWRAVIAVFLPIVLLVGAVIFLGLALALAPMLARLA